MILELMKRKLFWEKKNNTDTLHVLSSKAEQKKNKNNSTDVMWPIIIKQNKKKVRGINKLYFRFI